MMSTHSSFSSQQLISSLHFLLATNINTVAVADLDTSSQVCLDISSQQFI
ncbi:hypothetical protein KFK09_024726 [Dendrobium nobile]|uniref:Uncharacterized protein n=1 Tax=Dendrobium nobile TaxID=94219 RepID=A0A8T3AK20_DENNO|nr:hypothetical protein KFK09_024726 [Dendrobium nobile]